MKISLQAIHLLEFFCLFLYAGSFTVKSGKKIQIRTGLLVAINNNMRLRMSKRTIIHFIAWRFSSDVFFFAPREFLLFLHVPTK